MPAAGGHMGERQGGRWVQQWGSPRCDQMGQGTGRRGAGTANGRGGTAGEAEVCGLTIHFTYTVVFLYKN